MKSMDNILQHQETFFQQELVSIDSNLQENPIFNGKIDEYRCFPVDFPLNQSIDRHSTMSLGDFHQ